MARENLQLELVELQRRVAAVETRLGLLPKVAAPVSIGDASSMAEQLVLKRELLILRRRVQDIEERLGTPMPAESARPVTPTVAVATRQSVIAARAHSAFQGPVVDGEKAPREVPVQAEVRAAQERVVAQPVVTPPETVRPREEVRQAPLPVLHRDEDISVARVAPPRAAASAESLDGSSLEKLIGGKWFGWIGSIAVVIGVGLLMKYGYDQKWFTVPPLWRCMIAAAFGLTLIGIGELVRKRLNVVAAAGILAAGVGTVYASAFAAYRLYGLLTEVPGMVLLALAAGLGIAVGVRSRLVSVTALSLLGGYLAPFLIPGYSLPAVLPVFLLMLMAVGLTVSGVLGGKFKALRVMVWWATLIIGGSWAVQVGVNHTALGLTFVGLVWAFVHAELIYSTRGQTPEDASDLKRIVSWRPVLSSFTTTAWCVVLGVRALDAAGLPEWIAPAAMMSATAMLWLALAGALDTLRETPRTDGERLGAAMFAQASGLLLVTIALAFSPMGEVMAWAILALAAFVGARWLRLRALDVYAVVTLGITTVRALLLEAVGTRMIGANPLGFVVSDWTAVAAFVGGAWVVGAFLVRREGRKWTELANLMAGIGVCTAAIAIYSPRGADFTFSVIMGALAVMAAVLGRVRRSPGLVTLGGAAAAIALPLAFLTKWWVVTTPHAVHVLGLHLEPAALCLLGVAGAIGTVLWAAKVIGMTDKVPAPVRPLLTSFGAALALILAMVGLYHKDTELSSLCFAWLVLTMGVGVLSRLWKGRGLELIAAIGLVPVTLLWIPAYATRWSPSAAPFVLHPGLGVAALIAGAWALCTLWIRGSGLPDAVVKLTRVSCGVAIGALVFVGTSLEAVRIAAGVTADPTTRGAALSMWWGVLAIAMVAAGFWRRVQIARWIGLGVLGIAMFKAVFIDLSDVRELWRIVSFIGLGLMMLVVPVVYSRMSHVLKGRAGTLGA